MKRHALIHSDEKKLACIWCPYRTNIDSNLRKHCRVRHNEDYPPITRPKVAKTSSLDAASAPTPPPVTSRAAALPRLNVDSANEGMALQLLTPSPTADDANMRVMFVEPSSKSQKEVRISSDSSVLFSIIEYVSCASGELSDQLLETEVEAQPSDKLQTLSAGTDNLNEFIFFDMIESDMPEALKFDDDVEASADAKMSSAASCGLASELLPDQT